MLQTVTININAGRSLCRGGWRVLITRLDKIDKSNLFVVGINHRFTKSYLHNFSYIELPSKLTQAPLVIVSFIC